MRPRGCAGPGSVRHAVDHAEECAGVVVVGKLGGELAFGKMSSLCHQLLASKIKQTSFHQPGLFIGS